MISIHAPPRGATCIVHREGSGIVFQFTPLREGRRPAIVKSITQIRFQFTPLREGRRWRWRRNEVSAISIHAPPRGATITANAHRLHSDFNSRPSARGDAKRCYMANMAWIFQFTPLREGRRCRRCHATNNISISIHAPPRGATCSPALRSSPTAPISIHAPPRGATRRRTSNSRLTDFNSRPSARGDFPTVGITITCHYFNSRPSARGDLHPCEHSPSPCISIHAPPRGATDNGK